MSYDIFCQSVIGASHIKKEIPCEDSGLKSEIDSFKVFVLGDGHGDSNCPRSKIGSQYICEITTQELLRFAKDIESQEWTHRLFDKADSEMLVNQLVTSIFGKWSCAVNNEYEQNPLTEKECEEAIEYIDRYKQGQRIEHIYGTTLIAGLLTSDYLLLLQQGDGRCVVFNSDGSASQPIPWDDRCFANVTTSVCDVDAIPSCRYHIINLSDNPVIACIAGSDGVEDSFNSMDKMHVYYRNLLQFACENGVEALEKHLGETLPDFSANGSGDDTTICGIVDIEAFKSKLEVMAQDNEIIMIKDEIARAQERIDSMTNKLQFLKKKYEDATSEFNAVESRFNVLENEYKSIESDIKDLSEADNNSQTTAPSDAISEAIAVITELKNRFLSSSSLYCLKQRLERIQQEKEDLLKELDVAKAKKDACEAEYVPYKERYDGYVKAKEDAQKRLDELNA